MSKTKELDKLSYPVIANTATSNFHPESADHRSPRCMISEIKRKNRRHIESGHKAKELGFEPCALCYEIS